MSFWSRLWPGARLKRVQTPVQEAVEVELKDKIDAAAERQKEATDKIVEISLNQVQNAEYAKTAVQGIVGRIKAEDERYQRAQDALAWRRREQ